MMSLQTDITPSQCKDGSVRLAGESSFRGRVEICTGNVWGSVCAKFSSSPDYDVVCKMLGLNQFGTLRCELKIDIRMYM